MRRLSKNRFTSTTLLALLSVGLLTGCEEDVTAVLGTGRAFTLYGVLSPDLDAQAVLVFPVEGSLQPRSPEPLDATVTSADLTTGEVRVWRDSIKANEAGLYEHVFWSNFRAQFGHRYRIEAMRPSDGVSSVVEVAVPPRAVVDVETASTMPGFVVQPVRIGGGIPRVRDIEAQYLVRPYTEGGPPPPDFAIRMPYGEADVVKSGDDWLINLNLSRAYLQVRDSLLVANQSFEGIVLFAVKLGLAVVDEAWNPPGGVFDPDILVQPEAMSNVQNGFGFVGGGYRLQEFVYPSPEAIRAAGFLEADVLTSTSAAD